MKIVYNNIIPFKGYKAINILGCLFVRKGCVMSEEDLNHERIHSAQMKEMFHVFFYLWYFIEWIVRLFGNGNAYKNISFEKEAYTHEKDLGYLKWRQAFDWTKYL